MKDSTFDILSRISKSLVYEKQNNLGPGLMTGKTGISLYLFYYSRLVRDRLYAEEGMKLVMESFDAINKDKYDFHTYGDGITGIAWAIEHLVQNGFILREDVPFLEDLDEILHKKMMEDVRRADFDFLHGGLGTAVYFLTRSSGQKSHQFVSQFIHGLEREATRLKDGSFTWETLCDVENGILGCNFGLAHGLASITVFLSKAIKANIEREKSVALLNGLVKFILANRLDSESHKALFPNFTLANNKIHASRSLGWCYGDLPMGLALHRASEAVDNAEWSGVALETLLSTTTKTNLKEEFVRDASLCHGAAGIAQQYRRLYTEIGHSKLGDAAIFWINETKKMARFDDGLAGFKTAFPSNNDEIEWENQSCLVDGTAGIGLALMSSISPDVSNWDSAFLLS